MNLDVGNDCTLYLLVDSGADVSLLKSASMLGTAEFEPKESMRIRNVEGSVIETYGSIETKLLEGNEEIPFKLQLVNKQVDLLGDGILGRDFLEQMQARICYTSHTLTFSYAGTNVVKYLKPHPSRREPRSPEVQIDSIRVKPRSEVIVRVPVESGSALTEGLVERQELVPGVYLAESLVTIREGYALTGVLNTTEGEVSLPITAVKVTKMEDGESGATSSGQLEETGQNRYETLLTKLRMEHLNVEERRGLEGICFDYQDVFFLPGIS
jgi:hypothetical protein